MQKSLFPDERPPHPKGMVPKALICELYGFSTTTLKNLLNVRYFENLKELGYRKRSKNLSPKQYQFFTDTYGEP